MASQRTFNLSGTMEISHYKHQEYIISPYDMEMKLFMLPVATCFISAVFATPFILVAIFSTLSLRRETRFILLGNALLSDLIYLSVYTATRICNMLNVNITGWTCGVFLYILSVMYSGGVLTAALMVADTYVAVLWPLHYSLLLPPSRTKKLIGFLWITSSFFSGLLFLVLHFTQKQEPCRPESCFLPLIFVLTLHAVEAVRLFHIFCVSAFILCFSLIICCYLFLCYKTRKTGVWKSISSRASVTFMMHHFILISYYCPLLLLLVESVLYINNIIHFRACFLGTLTICDVLIVLPKGISPYLYACRYREIYKSLQLFFKLKRHHIIVTPRT